MKKIIYKITYPNNKIYISSDVRYGSEEGSAGINYFGSAMGKFIKKDFSKEEQLDFSIRKEILWYTEDSKITDKEVVKKEFEFIIQYQSNNPVIGYNRKPKFKEYN